MIGRLLDRFILGPHLDRLAHRDADVIDRLLTAETKVKRLTAELAISRADERWQPVADEVARKLLETEAERDAAREALPQWRPISDFPFAPMMVVYWRGNVAEAMGWTASICGENGRDERYDLGFWDGVEWRHIGTGHALFEFEEQYSSPAAPTHWAPLLPAALAKTAPADD